MAIPCRSGPGEVAVEAAAGYTVYIPDVGPVCGDTGTDQLNSDFLVVSSSH